MFVEAVGQSCAYRRLQHVVKKFHFKAFGKGHGVAFAMRSFDSRASPDEFLGCRAKGDGRCFGRDLGARVASGAVWASLSDREDAVSGRKSSTGMVLAPVGDQIALAQVTATASPSWHREFAEASDVDEGGANEGGAAQETPASLPSCAAWHAAGFTASRKYNISGLRKKRRGVYCDMTTPGGPWMLAARFCGAYPTLEERPTRWIQGKGKGGNGALLNAPGAPDACGDSAAAVESIDWRRALEVGSTYRLRQTAYDGTSLSAAWNVSDVSYIFQHDGFVMQDEVPGDTDELSGGGISHDRRAWRLFQRRDLAANVDNATPPLWAGVAGGAEASDARFVLPAKEDAYLTDWWCLHEWNGKCLEEEKGSFKTYLPGSALLVTSDYATQRPLPAPCFDESGEEGDYCAGISRPETLLYWLADRGAVDEAGPSGDRALDDATLRMYTGSNVRAGSFVGGEFRLLAEDWAAEAAGGALFNASLDDAADGGGAALGELLRALAANFEGGNGGAASTGSAGSNVLVHSLLDDDTLARDESGSRALEWIRDTVGGYQVANLLQGLSAHSGGVRLQRDAPWHLDVLDEWIWGLRRRLCSEQQGADAPAPAPPWATLGEGVCPLDTSEFVFDRDGYFGASGGGGGCAADLPLALTEGTYVYDARAGEGTHIFIVDSGVHTDHSEFIEGVNYRGGSQDCTDLSGAGHHCNAVPVDFEVDCDVDPELLPAGYGDVLEYCRDAEHDCSDAGHGTTCAGAAVGQYGGAAKRAEVHSVRCVGGLG